MLNTSLDINWAAMGKVGPVKWQGYCLSCWAFAATTQLESVDMIYHNWPYVRQSEQEMIDCTAGSCSHGGWPTYVYDRSRNHSASSDADYPYEAIDRNDDCKTTEKKVSRVDRWGDAGRSACDMEVKLQEQPLVVAVNADNDLWYNYSGGIIDRDSGCPD